MNETALLPDDLRSVLLARHRTRSAPIMFNEGIPAILFTLSFLGNQVQFGGILLLGANGGIGFTPRTDVAEGCSMTAAHSRDYYNFSSARAPRGSGVHSRAGHSR